MTCGLVGCDAGLLDSGVIGLAGLGPGLTPAGDDFLLGFVAGLFLERLDRARGWSASSVGQRIAMLATQRTTRLSGQWLRCAGSGQFGAPWHGLADGARTGDRALLASALARIVATGDTSGRAALSGCIAATTALSAG
ncbi:MAG: DUF2877 domain-containing protein [Caldilineaceae bacterium]|nr:DUF2877 domain-containing protein [Caldilineaceae bacterium]